MNLCSECQPDAKINISFSISKSIKNYLHIRGRHFARDVEIFKLLLVFPSFAQQHKYYET